MSRGLRNCNPGNIRLSGTKYKGETPSADPAFKCFENMTWGYRAMFVLLHTYRRRYGLSTIRQMISRYAPPSENFTQGYIDFVARQAGIGPDEPVDTLEGDVMRRIVAAMSKIENGADAVTGDVEAGWLLFVKYRP